jgi:ketosteroid isomerase-like protein
MAAAFTRFAADDAVILRSDSLVKGKAAIKQGYEKNNSENVRLTWNAEFVDVAASGDLAYTYGKYIYSVRDSTGKFTDYKGIFHTVWKRQSDGSWKFVWD